MEISSGTQTRVAVIGTLLCAAGLLAWIEGRSGQPPLKLLSQAYSRHRGLELRIPGADYAPPDTTRGAGASGSELDNLNPLIRSHFAQHPEIDESTPGWLHAKGRAALMGEHPEEAIAPLQLARDLGKDDPEVAIDLATGYFERAKHDGRAIDFSMAIELLSQTLSVHPDSSSALFNRALVFQQAFYYPNAAADWKRYLTLDRTSGWADEARGNLALVEEKLAAPENADDFTEIHADQAMRMALTPERTPEIAAVLRSENKDLWLADALPFRGSPSAQVLAAMATSRAALRMDIFEDQLRQLLSLSSSIGSEPLRVWLEFEELFRITHSPKVAGCMEGVDELVETCRRRGYAWFEIQTLLERSICEMASGDFATAEATDRDALLVAEAHHFPIASLRADGLLTGYLAAAGQYREAAEHQHRSLDLFWKSPTPYPRGQELFHDLVLGYEGLGRFHAARASAQSAAILAQRSGVAINEAVNRARWAGFSARVGMKREAAEQYSLASKLFDGMADSPAVQEYRAFAESFAALAGDGSSLTRFGPAVKTSTNPFVVVSYLHTAALLSERSRRLADARQRLEEAIAVIEKSSWPAGNGQSVLEWRDQLQTCFRDLTRVALLQNDVAGSYRIWQEFLLADQTLQGFRVGSPEVGGAQATVVTFAQLGGRYGVWVRSDDHLRFGWVSQDAAVIDRFVRSYSEICSQRGTRWATAQKAAKPLVANLLEFALQDAPRNRILLIQPDRELARLPWASLALADGEPLGQRFLVAVVATPVPSSGPLRVPEIRVRHALVVGATFLSSGAEYLPGIQEEIAAVRRAFPSAELIEGREASAARLSEAMENADALHFAGHAQIIGGRVQLLVAPDESSKTGLWRPGDRRHVRLNLAVLSACSTASYREPEDPRPESLASALLLDGAHQVIATLWDADSAAASYFMQSFYRNLRLNHPSTIAFAEASAETRHQAAWANPYYWASFAFFLRV